MLENFEELPLHDASLGHIDLDWTARTLRIELAVFFKRDADAVSSTLTFTGVQHVSIPHRDPWGPSVFVNTKTFTPPDLYTIEVQSGDLIEIHADGFELARAEGV